MGELLAPLIACQNVPPIAPIENATPTSSMIRCGQGSRSLGSPMELEHSRTVTATRSTCPKESVGGNCLFESIQSRFSAVKRLAKRPTANSFIEMHYDLDPQTFIYAATTAAAAAGASPAPPPPPPNPRHARDKTGQRRLSIVGPLVCICTNIKKKYRFL